MDTSFKTMHIDDGFGDTCHRSTHLFLLGRSVSCLFSLQAGDLVERRAERKVMENKQSLDKLAACLACQPRLCQVSAGLIAPLSPLSR